MNSAKQISIKFYAVLSLALLSLAFIVAITGRGVFASLKTASEVDDSALNSATPRIIELEYKKAIDSLSNKKAPALDAL